MRKHKQKSKFNSPNKDKKQPTLQSFFSLKRNSADSASDSNNCSTLSNENEEEPNSNSSSPDIIEGTPHPKPLSTARLSSRLNFALLPNGCSDSPTTSRKKLFNGSSNETDDREKNEDVSEVEKSEVKPSSKRTSDDAFNELMEEIKHSSPAHSIVSRSTYFENSNSKKRLRKSTMRLEEKILHNSPSRLITNEIGKRHSQAILTRKVKPYEVASISEKQTKTVITDSIEPKIKPDEFSSIDIENLGDLFYEDFNSCSIQELSLSFFTYCEIIQIENTSFGRKIQLKGVTAEKKDALSTFCYIKGYWGETELKVNDLVSIKARFDHSLNSWLVDEKGGFLVKYPNILLTGTSIVGSLFCLRKSVLSYLFPGFDPPNTSMLLGSLIHELFQEILKNKLYKMEEMKLVATNLLTRRRTLLDSYECDISLDDLQLELDKFLPRILSFINMYILSKDSHKMWAGSIQEIVSIEENFWVPQLGIKGKTDLIVEAKTNAGKMIIPVELKTGRPSNSVEHRGQIILYLMMMTELNMNTDTGLLLYLKENIIHEVTPRQGEINGLVTIRNNLVDYYVKNEKPSLSSEKLFSMPALPEPINHHSFCSKCPYLTVCSAALSKKDQAKLSQDNPLREISTASVQHLSSSHIDYVFHWLGLLKLEESEKNNERFAAVSDIWLLDVDKRRRRGFCIPHLQIVDIEPHENYFLHNMKQSEDNCDLMRSGIIAGDYIVISTSNRVAIETGFVHNISDTFVTLKLDRQLDKNMEMSYIVDKYSRTERLLGFNSTNLLLLLEDSDMAAALRKFIVDLELPSFTNTSTRLSSECDSILAPLNQDQRTSILKVLSAENFALIKGLPGTGKTATIVALVKLLVHLNYSVLITSHTHSAIDNILIRLKDSVDFLRLGSSHKVHPSIKSHCEDVLISDRSIKSTEDVRNFYNKKKVVGVTCMGCSHVLLFKRTFDFCIIDEASQVLQPSIFKALYSARKFVLIGDPDQLPPVVHNFTARRLGLSESLFHRLDHPKVTTTLHLQYRMNLEIMKFANAFAYQDQLKCDHDDVNLATIETNDFSVMVDQYSWLDSVLSSSMQHSVIFLNTSNLTMPDSSSLYSNQLEVDIATVVISAFKKYVKNAYDVGVIAPYREQVLLLKRHLSDLDADVEINTVDQFQGRDKDIIIFSSSRWSSQKEEGILGDKRRLTVAITRAKRKLIIIGNTSILQKCSTFNNLLICISPENMLNIDKL